MRRKCVHVQKPMRLAGPATVPRGRDRQQRRGCTMVPVNQVAAVLVSRVIVIILNVAAVMLQLARLPSVQAAAVSNNINKGQDLHGPQPPQLIGTFSRPSSDNNNNKKTHKHKVLGDFHLIGYPRYDGTRSSLDKEHQEGNLSEHSNLDEDQQDDHGYRKAKKSNSPHLNFHLNGYPGFDGSLDSLKKTNQENQVKQPSNCTGLNCTSKMGLGQVFKDMVGPPDPVPAAPASTQRSPPSKRQVYHSRFNHGCNFGGMFVQEEWISNEVFGKKAKGTSELDAVKSLVKQYNKDEARQKFEDHWNNWITDDDWKWLKDRGVTAVRVPIGYWMISDDNEPFCKDTPFEKYHSVYKNAWSTLKRLIEKAESYQIAVLVDLHGLPGGANEADHSGTTSGKAELWRSSTNQKHALNALEFIARDLRPNDNVCGIQILNEAPYEDDPKDQKAFYLRAFERIRSVNDDIPLVISDGWDHGKWIQWVKEQEDKLQGRQLGVIIDTHVYKCFSEDDKNKPPQELLNDVDHAIQDTDDADILVGEYSNVLDGRTWDKHNGNPPREELVKQYGQRQNGLFYHRARAGSYMWTYKFEHGRGGEWDFREMTDQGAIPNMRCYTDPKSDDYYNQVQHSAAQQALQGHQQYWQSVDPGKDWQFWRFEEGFHMGFADAKEFDKFDRSEIGRLVAWRKSRLYEHAQERGWSDVMFNFEHGFKQGIQSFLDARNQ